MENLESTDLFKIIGYNVKYYRKLSKLTQKELAEKTGLSRWSRKDVEFLHSYEGNA